MPRRPLEIKHFGRANVCEEGHSRHRPGAGGREAGKEGSSLIMKSIDEISSIVNLASPKNFRNICERERERGVLSFVFPIGRRRPK